MIAGYPLLTSGCCSIPWPAILRCHRVNAVHGHVSELAVLLGRSNLAGEQGNGGTLGIQSDILQYPASVALQSSTEAAHYWIYSLQGSQKSMRLMGSYGACIELLLAVAPFVWATSSPSALAEPSEGDGEGDGIMKMFSG